MKKSSLAIIIFSCKKMDFLLVYDAFNATAAAAAAVIIFFVFHWHRFENSRECSCEFDVNSKEANVTSRTDSWFQMAVKFNREKKWKRIERKSEKSSELFYDGCFGMVNLWFNEIIYFATKLKLLTHCMICWCGCRCCCCCWFGFLLIYHNLCFEQMNLHTHMQTG